MASLKRFLTYPHSLRFALAYRLKCWSRGFNREHYFTCIQRAVTEAIPLGHSRLTIIEFGVAAGKGLLEIEAICAYLEARHPIKFDIFGFDTGRGLPKPTDYRDTPWKWADGWYQMDVEGLKKKLKSAQLVLGDVAETVPQFLAKGLPSPIGAIMFDLDYYSSTIPALDLFANCSDAQTLPRVLCYFDDLGSIEDVGVMRAIMDFNESNPRRRIKSPLNWAHHRDPYVLGWKLYEFHSFDHADYQKLVRKETTL